MSEITIAVALTGERTSLLEDMEDDALELVARELYLQGIGDGLSSFFADIATFSAALDDTVTQISGGPHTDRMDLIAEISKQAAPAPEGEMLTLHLNLDGVAFSMSVVRSAGGVCALVTSVCRMLSDSEAHRIKLSDRYLREMEVLRQRRKERRIVLCGGAPISARPDLEPQSDVRAYEDRRGRKGDRIARRQDYRAIQSLQRKSGKIRR